MQQQHYPEPWRPEQSRDAADVGDVVVGRLVGLAFLVLVIYALANAAGADCARGLWGVVLAQLLVDAFAFVAIACGAGLVAATCGRGAGLAVAVAAGAGTVVTMLALLAVYTGQVDAACRAGPLSANFTQGPLLLALGYVMLAGNALFALVLVCGGCAAAAFFAAA